MSIIKDIEEGAEKLIKDAENFFTGDAESEKKDVEDVAGEVENAVGEKIAGDAESLDGEDAKAESAEPSSTEPPAA
jgi:ribosomal protein S17E